MRLVTVISSKSVRRLACHYLSPSRRRRRMHWCFEQKTLYILYHMKIIARILLHLVTELFQWYFA